MSDNNVTNTIMISGYYGFDNAGDEAILSAIIQRIRSELPWSRIIVLSDSPEKTKKEHQEDAFNRKNFAGIFKLMKKIDLFISGGGGLVQDATGFNTVVYYLSLVMMAKMRRKKVMLYANGLGPLHQKKSQTLARLIMNKADLITYRDEKSKALSLELGINKPEIHVTADPVFALSPAPAEKLQPILEKEEINADNFKLGISVRPWGEDNSYLEHIAGLADSYIREKKAQVFLFPFQESQDMETCKALAGKMENPAKIISRNYTIPEMMGIIGSMDMLLGMRLHSLIFALIQNVPSLGLSYDPKVTILMENMELPCLSIENLSRGDLFEAVRKLYDKRDSVSSQLSDKIKPYKEKAFHTGRLLKSLIDKK